MAYLIFTSNGDEFDRRELHGTTVIGRAPDCDISVHDIVLSRHHCKVERVKNEGGNETWTIVDLHSKNGTHLRGHKVEKHSLHDGDELRIGRTRMTFMAGAFAAGRAVRRRAVVRAHDPVEALAGTVTGMVVCEPGESGVFPGLPSPKPQPRNPSAYVRDDVYGMINDIISSSWDSVMKQNSEPVRMQRAMPVAAVTKVSRGTAKPRVSFALQAEDRRPAEIVVVKPAKRVGRKRRWIYASATVAICLVAFLIWQMMSKQTRVSAAAPAAAVETVYASDALAVESAYTPDDLPAEDVEPCADVDFCDDDFISH